jgi:hypothetical protein
MKSEMGFLLECQIAAPEELYYIKLALWSDKYPESAAYANAIPHEHWTYYTAALSTNPFCLFGRTRQLGRRAGDVYPSSAGECN